MVVTGKIKTLHQDRRFGFIKPDGGGRDLFFHFNSRASRSWTPVVGEPVAFLLAQGGKGPEAREVEPLKDFQAREAARLEWERQRAEEEARQQAEEEARQNNMARYERQTEELLASLQQFKNEVGDFIPHSAWAALAAAAAYDEITGADVVARTLGVSATERLYPRFGYTQPATLAELADEVCSRLNLPYYDIGLAMGREAARQRRRAEALRLLTEKGVVHHCGDTPFVAQPQDNGGIVIYYDAADRAGEGAIARHLFESLEEVWAMPGFSIRAIGSDPIVRSFHAELRELGANEITAFAGQRLGYEAQPQTFRVDGALATVYTAEGQPPAVRWGDKPNEWRPLVVYPEGLWAQPVIKRSTGDSRYVREDGEVVWELPTDNAPIKNWWEDYGDAIFFPAPESNERK